MSFNKPKYSKPPTTVMEQIALLLERGLEIPDIDFAEQTIQRIGFYRLKGFAHALRDHELENKPFNNGTSFNDIIQLIELDNQLRLQVFRGIQVLEPAIRTAINEVLCEQKGIRWYEHKAVFTEEFLTHRQGLSFEKFQAQRERQFQRSKDESFVKHYNRKYDTTYGPPVRNTAIPDR